MTAVLKTFTTTTENGHPLIVVLEYDKHQQFRVMSRAIVGTTDYPYFVRANFPNLLPALDLYNRQRRKNTVAGRARTEIISTLFDEAYKVAKQEKAGKTVEAAKPETPPADRKPMYENEMCRSVNMMATCNGCDRIIFEDENYLQEYKDSAGHCKECNELTYS